MRWLTLSNLDRAAYRPAIAFLAGRLADTSTIDWALELKPNDQLKRIALLDLLDGPEGEKIGEPWRSAWRLIEESWNRPVEDDRTLTQAYRVKRKLDAGDRSGIVVRDIANLVSPALRIKPFSAFQLSNWERLRRIKSVEHLFSINLTSGPLVSPYLLGLDKIKDLLFLSELASQLDAAVASGLSIARRLGWDDEDQAWRLGQLHRVYYVPQGEWPEGGSEPDEYDRGIAPSVKLLQFVVSRLADIDVANIAGLVHRWKQFSSSIYLRLWASLARKLNIASPEEVSAFLLSLDDRYFWNQNIYPEISELRAVRFAEFSALHQKSIARRLRKRPPRSQWPRNEEASRIENARTYWAVREMRRIEIAGGNLPKSEKAWVATQVQKFPDLIMMPSVQFGYMSGPTVRSVSTNPDARYDLLIGEERLKALEAALSSARQGWDDDIAESASSWIQRVENSRSLISDFESIPDGGSEFPKVWDRFGWSHSPTAAGEQARVESVRVLSLFGMLSDSTLRMAIDGLSNWFSAWEKHIELRKGVVAWRRLWPIAVSATNEKLPIDKQENVQAIARPSDNYGSMGLDTLNTPAGKLVGVFLAKCPDIQESGRIFLDNAALVAMRDEIISASGRSGLIAKLRLIEHLPYFLVADARWTQKNLIAPLASENAEALPLWRAVARQTRFTPVLKIIGIEMAKHSNDLRLDRETRQSLVFSLVIESLSALKEQRPPAIPYALVQQTIRSLDDEVRAHGAGAIERYVRELSRQHTSKLADPSAEELFRLAAKPFLQQVWPQEQSLSTPGTSRALADLPSTAQGAFAEAVDAIERFLVPFDCWSMLEYGLYGDEEGEPKLANIDDVKKAGAFLRLLDRTIGDSETSIIPTDLSDALNQVRKVAPSLAETPVFRRLSTAARRV
jgi:hypothetical protein